MAALTLASSGVSVAFSYLSRDFYNSLSERNEALFYEKIELFFGALLIAIPINVLYRSRELFLGLVYLFKSFMFMCILILLRVFHF